MLRFYLVIIVSTCICGCASSGQESYSASIDRSETTTFPGAAASPKPIVTSLSWSVPPSTVNTSCRGRRIGVYSWDTSYWLNGNDELIDFLDSEIGREWNCGNTFINIGDYSSAADIVSPDLLIAFAKRYRTRVSNDQSILYFTYGDVTAKDGEAMLQFANKFFDWIQSISKHDAAAMGRIGISFDVERMHPDYTERVLRLCQERRIVTAFGEKNLLIQYAIEGDKNVEGTDIVFRLADSALAMVYSNFIESGHFPRENGLLEKVRWLLSTQCPRCLDNVYSSANYKAKITLMVEASCQMGRSCSWASFCALDGPTQGAEYIAHTLESLTGRLPELITEEQYHRLFDAGTPYVVHNFEWYRCFAPFSSHFTYQACSRYHSLAVACRGL